MTSYIKEYTRNYYLAAGECNPQAEMPLTLLLTRVIEVATDHANQWGVGYERLIADNHAWVLSRVTVELERYPRVNENYSLTTWIEDYNRHFSQRNLELRDGNGETLGYIRTIWMVIDLSARTSVDISQLEYMRGNISDRPCPIEPQGRLRPISAPTSTTDLTFNYIDCDFNRHVNTVRYMEHLMGQFDMARYDANIVQRMQVAFIKESHYGDQATIMLDDSDPTQSLMSIVVDGSDHVRASFQWKSR